MESNSLIERVTLCKLLSRARKKVICEIYVNCQWNFIFFQFHFIISLTLVNVLKILCYFRNRFPSTSFFVLNIINFHTNVILWIKKCIVFENSKSHKYSRYFHTSHRLKNMWPLPFNESLHYFSLYKKKTMWKRNDQQKNILLFTRTIYIFHFEIE